MGAILFGSLTYSIATSVKMRRTSSFPKIRRARSASVTKYHATAARGASPPPASVLGVIGRLEALSGTEADAGRKEVLDKCVADLRAS
ncbi:hypothetical protein JCM24511_10190 [Saitozyma sp. JCM 24511]|nr:hypothetical protein JCM24511_10190 [Saitozyma sp. JCM 24511]